MSIYVDVSSAVHAKAGIGRYAGDLAQALHRLAPGRLALFYNGGSRARPLEGLEGLPTRTVRAGYKPWRLAVWLGHLTGLAFDGLLPGAELFHATEHLLPPLSRIPAVLTVHDMIFRLFPQHQKTMNRLYLNATMPLYCRRAAAIVTVSESSKRDILALYGIAPDKVHVIYEAAAPGFRPASAGLLDQARQRYGLPGAYLLHVGTIEPRKNLTRLVEALQSLRDEGLTIPLVVVGRKGWLYSGFLRRLADLDVRDSVLFPGYVPAADLPLLYCAATAVVMPSVYEGFGLPVLEALACGTPVLCSSASSLPEVAGDAACYFEPQDLPGMAQAVRRVWTAPELRQELRERGFAQAARFSWDRAAAETMAVYEGVLSPGRTWAGSG